MSTECEVQAVSLYRGDNANIQAIVHDQDGNAVNIVGASIVMTVRDIQTLTQQFQKTTTAGTVVITDGVAGKCVAYVLPADTTGLTPGRYVADFELTKDTIVHSQVYEFEIKQDITYT